LAQAILAQDISSQARRFANSLVFAHLGMFRIAAAGLSEATAAASSIRLSVREVNDQLLEELSAELASESEDESCSEEGASANERPARVSQRQSANDDHSGDEESDADAEVEQEDDASANSADDEASKDDDDDDDSGDDSDSDGEEDMAMTNSRERRRWRNGLDKVTHLRNLRVPAFLKWATVVYIHRDETLEPPVEVGATEPVVNPDLVFGPPTLNLSRANSAPSRRRSGSGTPLARRESDDEAPPCWVSQEGRKAQRQDDEMEQRMLREASQKRTNQWCQHRLLANLAARSKLRYLDVQSGAPVDRAAVAGHANDFDVFHAKVARMDEASVSNLCFTRPQRSHSMDGCELSRSTSAESIPQSA